MRASPMASSAMALPAKRPASWSVTGMLRRSRRVRSRQGPSSLRPGHILPGLEDRGWQPYAVALELIDEPGAYAGRDKSPHDSSVLETRLLKREQVLEGDDLLLHTLDFGDLHHPPATVHHALLVNDE